MDILNPSPSLRAKDEVSHTYKRGDKITVLHNLIFRLL
jgi:hypothetical protein